MSDTAPGVLDDYLSEAELADQLGLCVDTVERKRRLREGPPFVRISRRIFYHRDAVRDWLKKRQVEAA